MMHGFTILAMSTSTSLTRPARFAPAFTLVVLAPLIAEYLPGATRTSSLVVFPLEMAIWGGGALLIRAAVRHFGLGAWSDSHRMGLALGAILGSMAAGFVGFIYATLPLDLWGKIISNAIAVALILWLAMTVRARRLNAASSPRGA
jgi:hypothetical protein